MERPFCFPRCKNEARNLSSILLSRKFHHLFLNRIRAELKNVNRRGVLRDSSQTWTAAERFEDWARKLSFPNQADAGNRYPDSPAGFRRRLPACHRRPVRCLSGHGVRGRSAPVVEKRAGRQVKAPYGSKYPFLRRATARKLNGLSPGSGPWAGAPF